MIYQFFLLEKQNAIGILRFNRPDRLNAFDERMIQELPVALQQLLDDDAVRMVILTGNGRGFCAGADVNVLQELVDQKAIERGKAVVVTGSQVVEMIHGADKPVIAALNGPTAGGGAGFALACDIRLMAQSATIGFPFTVLGLHPDLGCTYFLPRLVGPAKAAELLMTGAMLSAEQALQLNIVNRVVADDQLMIETMQLAKKLAAKSPLALRLIKRGMQQTYHQPLDAILKYEVYAQGLCFGSEDAANAITEFRAARKK